MLARYTGAITYRLYLHWHDLPFLVVSAVVVPRADRGAWILARPDNVEHLVGVGGALERHALLVVAVLLVLAPLVAVQHQPIGTFPNRIHHLSQMDPRDLQHHAHRAVDTDGRSV